MHKIIKKKSLRIFSKKNTEFYYRDQIMFDANSSLCCFCPNPKQCKYNIAMCFRCFNKLTIEKELALEKFGLDKEDLSELYHFECESDIPDHFSTIYFLIDVRTKAIEKKYSIENIDYDTYLKYMMDPDNSTWA